MRLPGRGPAHAAAEDRAGKPVLLEGRVPDRGAMRPTFQPATSSGHSSIAASWTAYAEARSGGRRPGKSGSGSPPRRAATQLSCDRRHLRVERSTASLFLHRNPFVATLRRATPGYGKPVSLSIYWPADGLPRGDRQVTASRTEASLSLRRSQRPRSSAPTGARASAASAGRLAFPGARRLGRGHSRRSRWPHHSGHDARRRRPRLAARRTRGRRRRESSCSKSAA